MKYKYFIFDFNGTLLDDRDVCLKILNILTLENNLKEVSLKEYMEIFSFPVSKYYEQLGFDTNIDKMIEVGNKFHKLYDEYSYTEANIFEGAKKILQYLKNLEDIKIICLSASHIESLTKQLKYYEIDKYFDTVIGLNDKYARSKVEVAISWINENKIDAKKCVFIGDSIHDKEVADAMGVDCVLTSTGHTAKHRLNKCNCPVIDDLSELINLI